MADGTFTNTKTSWGYACSVTGGTASTTSTIVPKRDAPITLKAITVVGPVTSDNFTLYDGDDVQICNVACVAGTAVPVTLDLFDSKVHGLKIKHAGATSTGLVSIYVK